MDLNGDGIQFTIAEFKKEINKQYNEENEKKTKIITSLSFGIALVRIDSIAYPMYN